MKCYHKRLPGFCMDCAYPDEELKRLRAENKRLRTEIVRSIRAFGMIGRTCRDMRDPVRRAGPTEEVER